jgi:inner membrane transporter RhtA
MTEVDSMVESMPEDRSVRSTDLTTGITSAIPAPILLMLAIVSVQVGAATARGLFHSLGVGGTVFVRIAAGAIVLLLISRPRILGHARAHYSSVILFGLALAGMNYAFFLAIAHIPLGIAVTLEFVGPLSVALFGSRHALDVVWGLLAATGIVLLAPLTGAPLDPIGVAAGLTAGALWAAYILLNVRVGRAFAGREGLTLAMLVAALVLVPGGVGARNQLFQVQTLIVGSIVGLLSSAVPFSLEMEALRRVPARIYGVVISLEPVVATIIGALFLGESLTARDLAAIGLVTVAAAGSSLSDARENR